MSGELHGEIEKIKARNVRVEADKAWETSRFRVWSVAGLTYLMMVLLMLVIGVEKPYMSALVPTAGFMLSTLSLRFAKKFWIVNFYRKKIEPHQSDDQRIFTR
jgi:positive regulator of sigma E activity